MSQIAGWYPDPAGVPGRLRWWDGAGWTEHTTDPDAAPAAVPTAPSAEPAPTRDAVDAEIMARAAALELGPTLRAEGHTTVTLDPDGTIVSTTPDGTRTPLGTLDTPEPAPAPTPPTASVLDTLTLEPLEGPAPILLPRELAPQPSPSPTTGVLAPPGPLPGPLPTFPSPPRLGGDPTVAASEADDTPTVGTVVTDTLGGTAVLVDDGWDHPGAGGRSRRRLLLAAIVLASLALVAIGVLGVLRTRADHPGRTPRAAAIATITASGQLRDPALAGCFVDQLHAGGISYARLATEHQPSAAELALASRAMLACQPAATTAPR